LETDMDALKQREDKLLHEVQHYKSVLSDTVCLSLSVCLSLFLLKTDVKSASRVLKQ